MELPVGGVCRASPPAEGVSNPCSPGVGACVSVAAATVCVFLDGLHSLGERKTALYYSQTSDVELKAPAEFRAHDAFLRRHVVGMASQSPFWCACSCSFLSCLMMFYARACSTYWKRRRDMPWNHKVSSSFGVKRVEIALILSDGDLTTSPHCDWQRGLRQENTKRTAAHACVPLTDAQVPCACASGLPRGLRGFMGATVIPKKALFGNSFFVLRTHSGISLRLVLPTTSLEYASLVYQQLPRCRQVPSQLLTRVTTTGMEKEALT